MKRLFFAVAAFLTLSAHAQNLDGFNQRFRLVKDTQGNLVTIHDKTLSFNFSL